MVNRGVPYSEYGTFFLPCRKRYRPLVPCPKTRYFFSPASIEVSRRKKCADMRFIVDAKAYWACTAFTINTKALD
nr:MAG TPA: hypothetical protein [Caudoviricetes sp.]